MAAQHAMLSPERWARFSFSQQILMIGNEMNRAMKLNPTCDRDLLLGCYERVLRLVDLTVAVASRPTRRRELLRWRDLIAGMYIDLEQARTAHAAAFRCLLQFTPEGAAQIPLLLDTKDGAGA